MHGGRFGSGREDFLFSHIYIICLDLDIEKLMKKVDQTLPGREYAVLLVPLRSVQIMEVR